MGGHVIRPFKGMSVVRFIFFYGVVEIGLKILPDRRISIFINREGSGSVLYKNVEYARFDGADFG